MLLFQLSKYSLTTQDFSNEILAVAVGTVFIGFGVLLGRLLTKQKKKEQLVLNAQKVKELDLSARESEVLTELIQGKSNQEIANTLFISESTVKTHVSNILMKLGAKRRTQVMHNAKKWGLI